MQIGALILAFLGAFSGPVILVTFGLIWTATAAYCGIAIKHSADKERIKKWLIDYPERAKAYRWMVGSFLDRLQIAARPQIQESADPDAKLMTRVERIAKLSVKSEAQATAISSNPWGWPVFDFALRLAILYPATFAILQWLLTGQGAGFGRGSAFFDADIVERLIALLIILVAIAISSPIGERIQNRLGYWNWPLIFAFLAAMYFFRNSESSAYRELMENAAVGVVLVPMILFGFHGNGVSVLLVSAATFSLFTVLRFPVSSFWDTVMLTAAVVLPIFAFGSAVYAAVCILIRNDRAFLGYLICFAIWAAGLLATTILVADSDTNVMLRTAFLFLCILPLVNALFDYVSFGLTLSLVRWGLKSKGWMAVAFGILDLCLAAVILSILGTALVAMIAFINSFSVESLFPIAPILDGLKQGDPAFFWVYGIMLSTFLPTIVHLVISSLSLVSIVPSKWRSALWNSYSGSSDDWLKQTAACAGIGFLGTAVVTIPFVLGWGVIWAALRNFDAIGAVYLEIFRNIAIALGEPM